MICVTTKEGFQIIGDKYKTIPIMDEDGEIKNRQLKNLHIGDYLALERGCDDWGDHEILSEDDAYELGLFVSEGYREDVGNYVRLNIANSEPYIIEFLQSRGYKTMKDGRHHRTSQSKILLWAIRGTAHDKDIPEVILESKRNIVIAFLQGLFDGDGHAHKERGGVVYVSVALGFIRNLQRLLLKFGIVGRIYEIHGKLGSGYRLDIEGADALAFYEKIGFRLTRKQQVREVIVEIPRIYKDDSIPFQGKRIRRICYQGKRGQGKPIKYNGKPATDYIEKFRNTWRVRRGRKGGKISYPKLRELLEIRRDLKDTEDYEYLAKLLVQNYYWAKVLEIEIIEHKKQDI
jgi:intein/homing endonuclease